VDAMRARTRVKYSRGTMRLQQASRTTFISCVHEELTLLDTEIVAKTIQHLDGKVNTEALIPVFVSSLPIQQDVVEMESVFEVLLALIAR
jgi:hypothetical protein